MSKIYLDVIEDFRFRNLSFAFFVSFISNQRNRNRAGLLALAHCFGELSADLHRDFEAVSVVDRVHDDEGID